VDTDREHKTPGSRLRATLFVCYKHEGQPGEFEDYYRKAMEVFIDHVKKKLPQP